MKTRNLIQIAFAIWISASSLLFGLSPDREIFYIENLTREEITLTINYYAKLDVGVTRPSLRVPIGFHDSTGSLVARTSLHRSVQGDENIPVDRRRAIFDFYISPNRDTDSVNALEKFLQVVEEFTIKDNAGNILLSLEDLDEDSFVTYQYAPHEGNIAHVLEIRTEAEK